MKIQLVSDLHLEFHKPQILGFGPELRITNAGADVLVLAGDICTARDFESFISFFENCSKEFPHVIYIMGNHEHYKAKDFATTPNLIRAALKDLSNVHFLDNDCVTLDGIKFVGATLWTDLNKGCPLTTNALQFGMNDFRLIKYRDERGNYFKFSPACSYMEHRRSVSFIYDETDGISHSGPCVVVTHHAPSYRSVHPKYANDTYMNGGYASDMETLIHINDHIKLWCHGHMHNNFDYMVGDTRVVCNPHGYPGERENPNTNFIVEI